MILGDTCTRRCGFCNVNTGKPTWNDPLEPARVARSVAQMGLKHAVDHLGRPRRPARLRRERLRRRHPLDPDAGARLQGRGADARLPRPGDAAREGDRRAPRRLQPQLSRSSPASTRWRAAARSSSARRGCCGWRRRWAAPDVITKSGLMVGLGESFDEMVETFGILREHRVQVLTVGQYLRPTERHLPVVRYWEPEEFDALAAEAAEDRLRVGRRRARWSARATTPTRAPARRSPPAPPERRRRSKGSGAGLGCCLDGGLVAGAMVDPVEQPIERNHHERHDHQDEAHPARASPQPRSRRWRSASPPAAARTRRAASAGSSAGATHRA